MALLPAPALGTAIQLLENRAGTAVAAQIGTKEGAAISQNEGARPTFLFSFTGTLQATPTDILQIAGPATGKLRINRLRVSGIAATAAQQIIVSAVRRSALIAGGSLTAITPVSADILLDGTVAGGVVSQITTNGTTLGTALGAVAAAVATFTTTGAAGGQQPTVVYDSGRGSKPIVLQGTTDCACINLGSVTLANTTTIWVDGEFTYEAP
jgi:hypothetical protein